MSLLPHKCQYLRQFNSSELSSQSTSPSHLQNESRQSPLEQRNWSLEHFNWGQPSSSELSAQSLSPLQRQSLGMQDPLETHVKPLHVPLLCFSATEYRIGSICGGENLVESCINSMRRSRFQTYVSVLIFFFNFPMNYYTQTFHLCVS